MAKAQEIIKSNDRIFHSKSGLKEGNFPENPFSLFEKWMEDAVKENKHTANCMNLSTVSEYGYPSSRIVFLREYDDEKFIFYTNYNSLKAKDIAANDQVSALFFWKELNRQIRIEGKAKKIAAEQSNQYFANRLRDSQLGAWASNQSEPIDNRETLDEKLNYFAEKFKEMDVPRPNHWGGYAIFPERIEFWQGREKRLHDRILFEKVEKDWKIVRLAP